MMQIIGIDGQPLHDKDMAPKMISAWEGAATKPPFVDLGVVKGERVGMPMIFTACHRQIHFADLRGWGHHSRFADAEARMESNGKYLLNALNLAPSLAKRVLDLECEIVLLKARLNDD